MKIFKQTILLAFILCGMYAYGQAPAWNVNPNRYQYSMTITAVLDLNCVELTNPSNRLAAFVGDSIRGAALTSNVNGGRYQAGMTIYSDSVNNETVYFKFYDTVTDSIYEVLDSIAFQDNAIYGSPANPFILKTNNEPTQISITSDSLAENQNLGVTVGAFSTVDVDAGQSFSYALVSGSGGSDNALFSISSNNLIANFTADYESKAAYTIRVRTTDYMGCSLDSIFVINIKNVNDPPTALSINSNSINENNNPSDLVGSLSAVDPDANESFTYSLVAGAGGQDNASFSLLNSELWAAISFNYEAKSQYSIRLEVTDMANNSFVDTFKININDINDAPTDITVSSDSIVENASINTLIANLAAVDEDATQSHSFSFDNVAGNDNSQFNIVGSTLRTKAVFDFESQDQYFIYVQANDMNGGTYTKQININIKNINDQPTDLNLSTNSVNENMPIGSFVARLFSIDQDANDTFSYALVNGVGDADNGNFFIQNDSLFTNQVLSLNAQSSHTIRIETNDGKGGTYSKDFVLTVKDINDIPSDITLSNAIIAENLNLGSEIGTFNTVDADAGDIHAYSLVSGVGDSNNVAFSLSNNKLLSNTTFNFNQQTNYSIRVQTNDGFGGVYQKVFSITVVNSNDAPTDILLSNDSVYESMPPNTLIGTLAAIDSDSTDNHSFSFVTGANDNADFAIVGNQLRSASTFNFEAKNNYFIAVEVSDGNGGLFQKQLSIAIKDTTDGPSDITISSNTIQENLPTKSLVGVLSSTDEDLNDTFAYSLVSGNSDADNGSFQISNDSLFSVDTFDYEVKSQYLIRLRSTDNSNLFTEKAFAIQITNGNDAPTDLDISNRSISEDATLGTTVGIFTTLDPDTGNTHFYTLVSGAGDGDNHNFIINGNALKTDTVFDVNLRTAYSIRLRSTDGNGLFYEEQISLTVTNANDAPTDISLSPNNINENLPPNSLVGRFTSVDPDANDNHIYNFATLGANDNSSFIIVGDELRTSASFDFEIKPIYFIQVQTSDGNGGTYSRQLFVDVNDTNDVPTDLILSANSVDEKQATGQFIGKLRTIDQDLVDQYSYSFVNGNGDADNGSFVISNDSLFSNATFDVLVKSQLSLRIETADQDSKKFEKVFQVYVQDVNDAPNAVTISNASIPENTALNSNVGLFNTQDIDPNQSFTYQLVNGVGDDDNGNFVISGDELRTNVLFNYNNQRTHSIRVRSTDQGGLSIEQNFTVNITNSNDAPTNIALSPASFNENIAIGSTVATISTVDADSTDSFSYSFVNQGTNDNASFIITGDELRTAASFDFESKNLFIIEVQSRDAAGATYSRQLTLNVLDTNDAPTGLSISSDTLLEGSAVGSFVADLSTIDEDAVDNHSYTLVAGQGSNDNALFRINGSLLEVDSVLAFNNADRRLVRIRSSDQDGLFVESAFTIKIKNRNDAPEDILLSDTTANENDTPGSRIALISTVDEDRNDSFTYELVDGSGDDDNASFMIVGNELQNMIDFDFESQAVFTIRIRTSDNQGASFEKSFSIQLENGNEAPSIADQLFTVPENAPFGTEVGDLQATDIDAGDSLTFRLLGSVINFQMEASTGVLSANRSFDYEVQKSYQLQVEVSDAAGLKDTASVEVIIEDQVEQSLPVASYFSPNGDGRNDTWAIQNVELYSNYRLTIFSANGELVYNKAANYSNDWDGTLGGEELTEGIYYYFFEDNQDASNNFKGTITLKR
ncbi:MAG: cadherin domain-containing protein [Vicingaceae bacterium]